MHLGDPACTQVNDKSESTSWKILASKDILIRYRTSEYRLRKEIIEKKLSTIIAGKPSLLVNSANCTQIIDGFLGGYHYPNRKQTQEFTVKQEQPWKDGYYEHPMNCLEYIAVNLFTPIRRKKFPQQRPKKPATPDNI